MIQVVYYYVTENFNDTFSKCLIYLSKDIVTQIDIYLVLRALADVDAFILVDVEGRRLYFFFGSMNSM